MSQTLYDEVAYPSHPFPQTHPLRLALPAALFGLPYAPMETARVLEIGCGEGGNIIPLALSHPRSTIVGFDLAPTAIAAGREIVEALGLTNIRLEALDILDVGAELGQFDYIIAHGVYSWVPGPVREGVMRIIHECLAPEGLAFVSYNALPGCHLRLTLREMLLYHLRGVEGFEARVAGAHAFLRLFIGNAPDNDATAFTIKTYAKAMLERDPRVLFHDELGGVYEPFYLHEFVGRAEAHGLAFVSETEGMWWREELFPSSRGKALAQTIGDSDPVRMHQYLDFFAARLFRQTILTHADRKIDRNVDYSRIRDLWIAGAARAADENPDLDSSVPVRFELAAGAISLDHPGLKKALYAIGKAWPASVSGADLPEEADVHEGVLQLFCAGHLDLTVAPSPFSKTPGEKPVASPLARLQLNRGQTVLCSLDHTMVSFEDEESRAFLSLLDGSRTHQDLADLMIREDRDAAEAAALVQRQLKGLASLGLLVAA